MSESEESLKLEIVDLISKKIQKNEYESFLKLKNAIIDKIIEMGNSEEGFKKLCEEGFYVTFYVKIYFVKSIYFKYTECKEKGHFAHIDKINIKGFYIKNLNFDKLDKNTYRFCILVRPIKTIF